MTAMALLDLSRVEMKMGTYGVASALAVSDPSLLPRVQDYRRRLSSQMAPLEKADIAKKMMPANYHVSRKIDGEFTVLVYREGTAFSINPGGTIRVGLPWHQEAAALFSQAGISEALVAGELYVAQEKRRPRVHDVVSVARQPQSEADLSLLRFAVFDWMSLNGQTLKGEFEAAWKQIADVFAKGQRIHPVEAKVAADLAGIENLFQTWVEDEGGEGVVARSETAGWFKIKPRHTLDAVVVGFTESTNEREGLLHDLLLAVRRQDGTFQILTRVGGGFSEEERRAFLSDLKDLVVESEYAEINSDHVAYQMVRPEWVVEISCLDLVSQTTRGGVINRMVLDWNREGSEKYHIVRRMPLVSVISPQFIRRREDKTPVQADIRIEQVTEIVEIPLADRNARQFTLPKSELLKREVYTKEAKGETMVRKFVLWKTNKEQESEDYPAYVVHYTDFSPNRKNPLGREVRVSDSQEQIHDLWNELKEANIKRGWNLYVQPAESAASIKSEPATPVVTEVAAKKTATSETASTPATKKKAAKKKAAKKKTAATKTKTKTKAKTKKAATTAGKTSKTKKKVAGTMAKSAEATGKKAGKKSG